MSRSNIAYPYPVLTASDVELRVDSVEVDGLRQELNLISDREQVVALHHVKKQQWSSIILRVTVAVRGDEIGEGPWELPKCVAILRNRKTHVRRSVELDSCGQGRGMWTGEVEMYSDEHIGRTELDAQLVARVQGIEGRVIGTAVHRWTVDLEARRPTKERSIRMVWRDFTDESDPQLFTYRDDPWLVEAAGDEPTIFLNSAVEGLRTVLEGVAEVRRRSCARPWPPRLRVRHGSACSTPRSTRAPRTARSRCGGQAAGKRTCCAGCCPTSFRTCLLTTL